MNESEIHNDDSLGEQEKSELLQALKLLENYQRKSLIADGTKLDDWMRNAIDNMAPEDKGRLYRTFKSNNVLDYPNTGDDSAEKLELMIEMKVRDVLTKMKSEENRRTQEAESRKRR